METRFSYGTPISESPKIISTCRGACRNTQCYMGFLLGRKANWAFVVSSIRACITLQRPLKKLIILKLVVIEKEWLC